MIHVYDTAGVLVLVHAVAPHDDVAGIATDDADTVAALVGAADVVLVAFDGDTGARFTADDWSRAW